MALLLVPTISPDVQPKLDIPLFAETLQYIFSFMLFLTTPRVEVYYFWAEGRFKKVNNSGFIKLVLFEYKERERREKCRIEMMCRKCKRSFIACKCSIFLYYLSYCVFLFTLNQWLPNHPIHFLFQNVCVCNILYINCTVRSYTVYVWRCSTHE